MKNIIKISILATLMVSGGVFADEKVLVKTITDYLNDKNASYFIVRSGNDARLTTFGLESAAAVCKDIKSAGYSMKTVRNYSKDERIMTVVDCS